MDALIRYFCEACGAVGLEGEAGDPFRREAKSEGREWVGSCSVCGGLSLDLSFVESRAYLDERIQRDDDRRDRLSLVLSAPFGLFGLALGSALVYVLWVGLPSFPIIALLAPLVSAGAFVVIPAALFKRWLRPKQAMIELTDEQLRRLEALERQRERPR